MPTKQPTDAQLTIEFHRMATARRVKKQKTFDPLTPILNLGMQVIKDNRGKIKVFGFDKLPGSEAVKIVKYIKKNIQAISATIDILDTFKVNKPGYCLTCPAYVRNWELVCAGKIHREWCVHSAYFLGKPAKPIMLKRYDLGYPAFHRKHKKKDIECPLIKIRKK